MSIKFNRREFIKLSALSPLSHFSIPPSKSLQNSNAKNILIILFDALSAANISLYGYQRETMPNLARFAERATVYHNHIAGGNFTSSGTASLFTGVNAFSHRAYYSASQVEPEFVEKNIFSLFNSHYRLVYSQNQWAVIFFKQFLENIDLYKKSSELFINTSLITNIFRNDDDIASLSWYRWNSTDDNQSKSSLFMPDLNKILGEQVLTKYAEEFPRGLPRVRGLGEFLLEHAMDWLRDRMLQIPNPYLFYFHMLPPHSPYHTRKEFVDIFDDGWGPLQKPPHLLGEGIGPERMYQERQYYDEYISYVDAEFGRLVDWMEDNGILDDTIVLFTSDHGEIFERQMLRHSARVFHQPLVHIPLLISVPGQTSRKDVFSPTNAVDVLPTLLSLNGYDIPPWLEGNVLPPFQSPTPDDRPFFCFDGREFSAGNRVKKGTGMIIRWPYKLMYYWGYQQIPGLGEYKEMYNLQNDPGELNELSQTEPVILTELEGELKQAMLRSGKIVFPE